MSELSDRIKSAMNEAGISQRELEQVTGIPHSAIQRYASGDTEKIPISRLKIIAEALHTTAEHLLGWDEEKKPVSKETSRADEFVELFSKLTDEQQKMIIAQIKGILSNQ